MTNDDTSPRSTGTDVSSSTKSTAVGSSSTLTADTEPAKTPPSTPTNARSRWAWNIIAAMKPADWIQIAIAFLLFWTLRAALDSLELNREALQLNRQALHQNNLATIYSLSQSAHNVLESHPLLAKYFDKYDQNQKSEQQLRADLSNESRETQILVELHAEKIADFMHLTFNQKTVLPEDDWNTWWAYFGDVYDESFALRDYFDRRPTWYHIGDILKNKEERKAHIR